MAFFSTAAIAATATAAAIPATTGLLGITLGTAGTIASIASTGFSILSGIQQSQASSQTATYQAAVARNNQIIANQQAQDAIERGKQAETLQRKQARSLSSSQRAALAANGVLINEGSALDIVGDTAAQGELDALLIRSNAEREAQSFRNRGTGFESEAGLLDTKAANIESGIPLQAAGTLLSGAATVSSKWQQFDDVGATV